MKGGGGGLGFSVLRFWLFLDRFLRQKNFGFSVLVFIVVCGFSVFSMWFSIFAKITNGFSDLISMRFSVFPI